MGKITEQKPGKNPNVRFASCHACLELTNQYAKCSLVRCKNYYCFSCIYKHFDKDFLPENYLKAKDCWVCYSCGGNCKCRFCVGIDRNRKKRKPKPEADSASAKSTQKKGKQQNPSQQDPVQNAQNQGSSKKKIIYSNRRLPVKKNNAFKYRTKRRGRAKSSVDVKSLLENIKPEDKIFKIKRDQPQESSQSQSQNNFQRSQKQMNSGSQEVSASINLEKDEKRGQRQKRGSKDVIDQNDNKRSDKKNRSRSNDNSSSSLDYLGQKDKKQNQSNSDQNKTKHIRKSTRISKLPTIKSIRSKKQSAVSKSSIKLQVSENQSGSKSQNQSVNESGSQQNKKTFNRRNSRRGRGSRSRTRGAKRRSQFRLKKQDISESQRESEEESQKEKPRKVARRGRQAQPQTEKGQVKQRKNKRPISSRQAKQLRDLMQNSVDIPRRRSQRNYPETEQKSENKIQHSLKQESESQEVSVKPSQSGKQNQNLSQSQQKGSYQVNKKRQPKKSKLQNNDENYIQDDEDDEQQNERKPKRNSMVKKHYLEELQKNKQYQVDSSDSEQPKPNQDDNQQPKQSNLSEQQNQQNYPSNNLLSSAVNSQKHDNSGKQKALISQQKSGSVKSPQKGFNITVSYKKHLHHKKNMPQASEVAHRGVQKNNIVNKWKTIQDYELVDITNIKKLGMLALFARQNLSKEMNDLMRRRNLVMQKMKLQAETPKQVVNATTN